jgi:ABC-type antimicrobial peptide transport system permease subunit
MFVRHGLFWGGIGVVIGLVSAVPLSNLMSSLLFEVEPIDLPTYGVMATALLAAAAAASYLPARRVTRVEPVEALRSE